MLKETEILRNFPWQDFSQAPRWEAWREAKIRVCEVLANTPPVAIDSLSDPDSEALSLLRQRCAQENFALFEVDSPPTAIPSASAALVALSRSLGFVVAEDHRSAGHSGVVALRTTSDKGKAGYIPYTRRPLNWHTDGYYNPKDRPVMGFLLYCHRQAEAGGENQLVDPELAYLRLREVDPAYVRALMHPQAMTIPENREADGTLRPASVGPVFFPDPASGRLQMRYTARTRSIAWRDDPDTKAAQSWLRDWLTQGDPLMRRVRFAPGQGVVSNNVLHNRTGFEDGDAGQRVVLRIRFHERAAEDTHGTA